MIVVQHKTEPQIIPITFYIFKDTTRPLNLLSFPTSVHLGIIEFKVPNEATTTTVIDAIINISQQQYVTFSSPIQSDMPITQKKRSQQAEVTPSLSSYHKTIEDNLLPGPTDTKDNLFPGPSMPKTAPFQNLHHHGASSKPFNAQDGPFARPFNHTRCARYFH